MSDNGSAGHLEQPARLPASVPTQGARPAAQPAAQTPAGQIPAGQVPAAQPVSLPSVVLALPHPAAMLVVDALTGLVSAANPAGRRTLDGPSGLQLGRWLHAVAASCADGVGGETTVRVWRAIDGSTATPVTLWAQCTPMPFRGHPSVLVVLREDVTPDPALDGTCDPTRAVFTMDAVGRVDTWGTGARSLTGFAAEVVVGCDTTLLHTGPARLAGEQYHALTEAYRHGEHRSEGWRICSDGRVMWAEVVTCALYDGLDRLLGFAVTLHDLTERHGLLPSQVTELPAPRDAAAVGPVRRSPRHPAGRRRPGPRTTCPPAPRRPTEL